VLLDDALYNGETQSGPSKFSPVDLEELIKDALEFVLGDSHTLV
jgi:hypothetical protein